MDMSNRKSLTAIASLIPLLITSLPFAQEESQFHGAPAAARTRKNPFLGETAAASGQKIFARTCATCHGPSGLGNGNVPALASGQSKSATDGELFWYITKGDINNGMPSWSKLPASERWQVISYIRRLQNSNAATPAPAPWDPAAHSVKNAPPPHTPFTDYRYEKPGAVRKITLADLPKPFATASAGNGPNIVPRPQEAWPQVPAGIKVEQYAIGLDRPRMIRTAPNGDFFIAESRAGNIKLVRGLTPDGKAELISVFATGLNRPFGINFYPPGPDPKWLYVGDTDAVLRFPYENGDLKARGPAEHVVDLPLEASHWTRDIQFTPDGNKMFVSVGSASNVDDPDTTPAEKNRADILEFNPDGSNMRVYASGIRNAVGLAIEPKSHELWCSVNERDGLGDNLVPDYITHVQEGGFYGWPWWYMGGHQDPRHSGKHPELKDKVITPDVILQPHNASLGITFYDGKMFPDEYQGDIFAAEHGSWNKETRAGYEVIRIPLHQTDHPTGEYEDFMTGFAIDNGHVWGRPVGVAIAHDGSLLVSDDASGAIWRITYNAKQ